MAAGFSQVEHPEIPEEQALHTVVSLYSLAPQLVTHFLRSTEMYLVQIYTHLSPSSYALESS